MVVAVAGCSTNTCSFQQIHTRPHLSFVPLHVCRDSVFSPATLVAKVSNQSGLCSVYVSGQ